MRAEYRRRTWLSVVSMDDMASFLGGFPRIVPSIHSDTAEPRNLHGWELSGQAAVLPDSRPLDEITEATYLIAKGRLFRSLGRVADFSCTPHLSPYQSVLDIDHELGHGYQSLPLHMRAGTNKNRAPDGNDLQARKANFSGISLLCLYHKGMLILHRRFLAKASVDSRFQPSRDRCISSALALLNLQKDLEPAFYRLTLARQILMLAAMTLFLELELRRKAPSPGGPAGTGESYDDAVLVQALETSCSLWAEATRVSDEADKIHGALLSLLSGLQDAAATCAGTNPSSGVSPGTPPNPASRMSPRLDAHDLVFSLEKDSLDAEFDWVCISALTCRQYRR